MYQHQPSDPDPDDDLDQLGESIYQGDGLQVRGLTEEELARFLAAHAGEPARLVGSGWTNLEPRTADEHVEPERQLTFKRQLSDFTRPASTVPIPTHSAPPTGSYGVPGASAHAIYRRLRVGELADWRRGLLWRLPLAGGAGIGAAVLTSPLPSMARLAASLATVGAIGWRLRFRASAEASAWRKGAHGERRTARRLRRLARRGHVAFHDLGMPGSRANIDHLLIGPSGVFVIDSKQYTGRIQQTPDGHIWHNYYPLDEQLQTVRAEASAVEAILGTPIIPVVCIHGASVQWGGLNAQGVAVVPAGQLRAAVGADPVLSAEQVAALVGTAQARLRPAR